MIICIRSKRKKNGRINEEATADIRTFRKDQVDEITRESGGKVLVRVDGEPGEFWDGVIVDDELILSDELRDVLERLEVDDD
ncbi:MAG: hypothetical protein J6X49_02100 [Victivallales bacterium]|nr:hypothetical protein [Victivallales bacterium]